MTFLLDTCTVLWSARAQIVCPNESVTSFSTLKKSSALSVVPGWEIALKPELVIPDAAGWLHRAALKLQARVLSIRREHVAVVQSLPARHRHHDPFDRMLIAGDRRRSYTADKRWRN